MMNKFYAPLSAGLLSFVFYTNVYANEAADLAWKSLRSAPPQNSSRIQTSATSGLGLNVVDNFAVGEVRTRTGSQALLVNAISTQTESLDELFELAFETVEVNENTLEVLEASVVRVVDNIVAAAVSGSLQAFGAGFFESNVIVTGIRLTALESLEFNSSTFAGTDVVISFDNFTGSYSVFDASGFTASELDFSLAETPINFFQEDAGIFYGINVDAGGDFDTLVDGFIVSAEDNNLAAADAGDVLLTGFSQNTSITGACSPCGFSENDNETFEAVAIGGNTTHGVGWALILPPFDVNDPAAKTPNGVMSYITAAEITPRDQLPNTGIGTYDNLIGGGEPFHATAGVGQLDNFSATVDFATAQVTNLAFDGRFQPGDTFSVDNGATPAAIAANGTFASGVTGTCSFCGSNAISGQFAGGFISNGNALIGAYGLRPQNLPGSSDSIVGSVLVTQ